MTVAADRIWRGEIAHGPLGPRVVDDVPPTDDAPRLDDIPMPNGPEDYGLAAESIAEFSASPELSRPLDTITGSDLIGVPPEQEWHVHERVPIGVPTLFMGDGDAGKTLLLCQLAAQTVMHRPDWLGHVLGRGGPVIFLSGEEPKSEVWRRLDRIGKADGFEVSALWDLHLWFPENGELLAVVGQDGHLVPTDTYRRLEALIETVRPASIMIDSVAAFYGGKQLERTHVRSFIKLMSRLAARNNCSLLLVDHPSLSGMATGTGRAGHTDWSNAVRSRLYLTRLSGDDENGDLRHLKVAKANYGRRAEPQTIRWSNGRFVPEGAASALETLAAEAEVDALFLKLLDEFVAAGRPVRPTDSRSGAPNQFSSHPLAVERRVSTKALKHAMERLLAKRRIVVVTNGPPSKEKQSLVRAEVPSEPLPNPSADC